MSIEIEINKIFNGLDTARFNADKSVANAAIEAERQVVKLLREHGVGVNDAKMHEAFKTIRLSSLLGNGHSGT